MKIPKKLKIGGHIFKIESVKYTKKQDFIDYEGCPCGDCDIPNSSIRIYSNQTQSQIEESLIHEILHAINNTLDHSLLHNLAHSLHQVLRDNKLLK